MRHYLHEANLARHMREDISEPEAITALLEAEAALTGAWNEGPDTEEIENRLNDVAEKTAVIFPPRSNPRLRENVEILAVAIVIAMGFRTYFIQPFKIPTGSMQPTLFGITVNADTTPSLMDRLPLRYLKFITTGKRYIEIRAKQDGRVIERKNNRTRKSYLVIEQAKAGKTRRTSKRFFPGMSRLEPDGALVQKGDLLAQGEVVSGDHIFVDKVRYNFTKPKRGQIVVFRTEAIKHPQIQVNDHYIKRLAGMPGEEISIDPPHLYVREKKILEPAPFRRMVEDVEGGYGRGYQLAKRSSLPGKLAKPGQVYRIPEDGFLPLGDNTDFSLDGRYFGAVPLDSLIGPAFAVYWPFGPRWGKAR